MDVWEEHPELHHYTSTQGLEGILRSQRLWAKHHADLNDTTEVVLFREALVQEMVPFSISQIRNFANQRFSNRRQIRKTGSIPLIAREDTNAFIDAFYNTTFRTE